MIRSAARRPATVTDAVPEIKYSCKFHTPIRCVFGISEGKRGLYHRDYHRVARKGTQPNKPTVMATQVVGKSAHDNPERNCGSF